MADMDTVDIAEPRHHKRRRSQSQSRPQKPVKNGTWLPAEDVLLSDAVARYGTRWVRVAGEVKTRNGDQCAKRWNENLKPELDHSPWTPEEDEQLLTMVESYGRNWKFLADSFLEMRAPLALKNRYSLLMRRLNRQSNGQQQASGARTPRHAAFSVPSGGLATPTSPNSAVDLTSFFGDYASVNAASSNFSPLTGSFGAGMIPPGDATITDGQRGVQGGGGTAPRTGTKTTVPTSWDDQNPIWHPSSFLGGGMLPDNVDNELEKMTTMSDNGTGGQRLPHSGHGSSVALSGGGNSCIPPAAEAEYTVTCQRGKAKTLMSHLVDAAMSESAEWTAEDDQVTIWLRVKV